MADAHPDCKYFAETNTYQGMTGNNISVRNNDNK